MIDVDVDDCWYVELLPKRRFPYVTLYPDPTTEAKETWETRGGQEREEDGGEEEREEPDETATGIAGTPRGMVDDDIIFPFSFLSLSHPLILFP